MNRNSDDYPSLSTGDPPGTSPTRGTGRVNSALARLPGSTDTANLDSQTTMGNGAQESREGSFELSHRENKGQQVNGGMGEGAKAPAASTAIDTSDLERAGPVDGASPSFPRLTAQLSTASATGKPYSAFPKSMRWFIVSLIGIAAICTSLPPSP
jgi:hypothetical protein